MRKILVLLVLFNLACKTDKNLLEKGVSEDLAKYRKQQIENITYHLDFSIPEALNDSIAASLKIDLTILDLENDLILDFNEEKSKIHQVEVNENPIVINHENEHLWISKNELKLGENTITIRFTAGEQSLNRNKEFLYTLLVPDRASTLFPCFDQPDLKAKFKLSIKAPKDWKVMAGGKLTKWESIEDYVTHTFAETDLMSTYLFSFVAGKFNQSRQNPGAFPMRFLYRENDEEKLEASLNTVFEIHQNALDFLEEYTQLDFPFQKMDFAAIPPFQYGGMEHVGAIQYRQSSLFLDKDASENRKLSRAKLIAHETAHMWFGDLVTMRWFNDVWMKEVFANFMADKIMNPVFPEINHRLSFMMTHYPSAYSEDRTKGTNPIRQQLDNLKNAGSLYGRIIYNKAPIMMRQLELLLGEEAFRKGIQEYMKTYQNNNADWGELVAIFDKYVAEDISKWSDVWVNSAGRPIFFEEVSYDNNGKIEKFLLHQKAEDGSSKIWPQSFEITWIDTNDNEHKIKVSNIQKTYDLTNQLKGTAPKMIHYNSNALGYGVFPMNKQALQLYMSISDDTSRGYQFINLYENVLIGKLTPSQVFPVLLEALLAEKNQLISNYLSGRVQTIYWTFLTSDQQQKVQNELEEKLWLALQKELPLQIKRTLFRTYQSIAHTKKGQENLYQIWSKKIKIDQLTLNENDQISLASNLAIYNHELANEILTEQRERITNKDRKERFTWLMPSLSNDVNVRDRFMQSLFAKENREKESWVQAALNNIHHPLRQQEAVKHIDAILNKLEEVQLTGDIFFPKGWLASSVGNHSSSEAYEIVQQFLESNKEYKPSLLQKLLQVTDNLERAQTIKK